MAHRLYSTEKGGLRLDETVGVDATALRLALQLAGGWCVPLASLVVPDARLGGALFLVGFVFASALTAYTLQEGQTWHLAAVVAVRHAERLSELEAREREARLPAGPPTREIWRETPTGMVRIGAVGEDDPEGQGDDDAE